MGDASKASDGDLLLDYQSPQGPEVTHLRGLLLMNALDNLRTWGVYEAYKERLEPTDRELLTSTIATSWVPIERALLHYDVVDALPLEVGVVEDAGRRMARKLAEMLLGPALRAAKQMDGIAAFAKFVLAQNDKRWERMYQGGRCRALRLGPREFLLEDYGNPLARSPVFRRAYCSYMMELASMFEPDARVSHESSSEAGGLATRFLWV